MGQGLLCDLQGPPRPCDALHVRCLCPPRTSLAKAVTLLQKHGLLSVPRIATSTTPLTQRQGWEEHVKNLLQLCCPELGLLWPHWADPSLCCSMMLRQTGIDRQHATTWILEENHILYTVGLMAWSQLCSVVESESSLLCQLPRLLSPLGQEARTLSRTHAAAAERKPARKCVRRLQRAILRASFHARVSNAANDAACWRHWYDILLVVQICLGRCDGSELAEKCCSTF